MPLRNIVIMLTMTSFALVCYAKAPRNRYAALVARGMEIVAHNSLQHVDTRELFEHAMNGMVSGLDQHSRYLPPAEYRPLQEDLDQRFGGIGIIVEQNTETKQFVALSVMAGSPAQKAGMRPGDVLVSIEDKPLESMTMSDVVDAIRGRPGTAVHLVILHSDSATPVPCTPKRQIIPVPSVLGDTRNADGTWQFVLAQEPQIGYLRINTFGEDTVEELEKALRSIDGQVDSLIVDLRNNAGGLLTAAVDTCDMFLSNGMIVTTRGRDGQTRERFAARQGVRFPETAPMVVLVNHYSASASEIVAACLQDHGRAIIVGERSWGKGTVQNIYPFEGGKSALKLTVATYSRPSGENIHRPEGADESAQWGVRPTSGCEITLSDDDFVKIWKDRNRRDLLLLTAASGSVADNTSAENTSSENTSAESSTPTNDNSGASENPPSSTNNGPQADVVVDPQLLRAIEYLHSKTTGRSPD